MLLLLDSELYITLEQFIADNTAEGVEPLEQSIIDAIKALKKGQLYTINMGAGGTTLVECLGNKHHPDEKLQHLEAKRTARAIGDMIKRFYPDGYAGEEFADGTEYRKKLAARNKREPYKSIIAEIDRQDAIMLGIAVPNRYTSKS
jgi:hypothetical protein